MEDETYNIYKNRIKNCIYENKIGENFAIDMCANSIVEGLDNAQEILQIIKNVGIKS